MCFIAKDRNPFLVGTHDTKALFLLLLFQLAGPMLLFMLPVLKPCYGPTNLNELPIAACGTSDPVQLVGFTYLMINVHTNTSNCQNPYRTFNTLVMAAAGDFFGDPLTARSSTLQVAYYDSDGLWPLIEQGFYAHMPLQRCEWTVPSTCKGYILPPMTCAMTSFDDESLACAQIPVNWYRLPFAHILLVRCESIDEFRRRVRQTVRQWTDDMEARGLEWMVIYVPVCTRQGTLGSIGSAVSSALADLTKNRIQVAAGTTLSSRTYRRVFDQLRTECAPTSSRRGGAHTAVGSRFLRLDEPEGARRARALARARFLRNTQVTESSTLSSGSSAPALFSMQLAGGSVGSGGPVLHIMGSNSKTGGGSAANGDSSPGGERISIDDEQLRPLPTADAIELEAQWSAVVSRLQTCVLEALSSRVAAYEAEGAKLLSQGALPGWNYGQYFCIRESLAFVYSQVT